MGEAQEVVSVMDQYSEASGSKVNQDKCEIVWMGRECESFLLLDTFPVSQQIIKILGINFGPADYSKSNWEDRLSDDEVKVRCWKGWRLSLRERVDLIKTFLVPTFLYVSFVCLLPESLYTGIYSCFFQMLLGNRLNLVRRDVTYSSRREGGLGMVNLIVFFSLMFLKHNFGNMLAERPPAWVGLFQILFRPFLSSWESGGPVRSLRVKHGNSWVRGLWQPLSMCRWP
ncbi:unnamed protein product [Staurois parvus]|uniref:Uncharacterized protein n=1 Tax=Staurois parvus TaxID=386267 RepID=A0ABN9G568_9NEOB|nr:unnamed protein product [Staurois parvus]